MSNQKKQQLSLEFMSELDQDGNKKVELKRSKLHQDKDDMMSNHIPIVIQEQLELQLFMLLVSSKAQQSDINRQIAAITNLYPKAEVISEIGGGLNFKRKKLLTLLEQVIQGNVKRIIVAHKDRLARFRFDL